MSKKKLTRREMLRASGIAIAGGGLSGLLSCVSHDQQSLKSVDKGTKPFRISLNTSTIRGYKLPVEQQIDLCAKAGFDGIELWVSDVEAYVKAGGTPESLNRQIKEHGLILENMIAFSTWISDDSVRQAEGVQKMRQDMELTARLGGAYIAAPAQGISHIERERLQEYSERYRSILEEGDHTGVTPIIELWGGGVLNQLSDIAAISIGTAHPKASMLLDFYHLYRGGNSFNSLWQINGKSLPIFHINDYPDSISRETLKDADRIFPGDGICPFDKVLPLLHETGFCGGLSIELFNQTYWDTMSVQTLLKKSMEKITNVIKSSMSV